MIRKTLALAFSAMLFTGHSSAALLSYTGSELSNLSNVTFPTRDTSVKNDSLLIDAGTSGTSFDIFMKWDLFDADFFDLSAGTVSVDLSLDWTRFSVDSDLFFGLSDGTNLAAVGDFDGKTLYTTEGATVTGDAAKLTRFRTFSYSPTVDLFASSTIDATFELSQDSVDFSIASNGTTSSSRTTSFDGSSAISIVFGLISPGEKFQIENLEVESEYLPNPPAQRPLLNVGVPALLPAPSAPPASVSEPTMFWLMFSSLPLLLVRKRKIKR